MTRPLDPRLLLQGYAAGIFPMADSRDAAEIFWVEPRQRAILPLDRLLRWMLTHLGLALGLLVAGVVVVFVVLLVVGPPVGG